MQKVNRLLGQPDRITADSSVITAVVFCKVAANTELVNAEPSRRKYCVCKEI